MTNRRQMYEAHSETKANDSCSEMSKVDSAALFEGAGPRFNIDLKQSSDTSAKGLLLGVTSISLCEEERPTHRIRFRLKLWVLIDG